MGILRKSNRRNIKIPKLQSGKTLVKVPKAPEAVKAQASMPKIPAGQNRRSGLAGMLKRGKSTKEKENSNTQSPGGGSAPGVFKSPNMKKGGSVMTYKDGGCVAGNSNRRRRMQEMVK